MLLTEWFAQKGNICLQIGETCFTTMGNYKLSPWSRWFKAARFSSISLRCGGWGSTRSEMAPLLPWCDESRMYSLVTIDAMHGNGTSHTHSLFFPFKPLPSSSNFSTEGSLYPTISPWYQHSSWLILIWMINTREIATHIYLWCLTTKSSFGQMKCHHSVWNPG